MMKTANGIWDFLKEGYEGSEKIKRMQALNLIQELEIQRMKHSETLKDYVDKLLRIANKIRLLSIEIPDSQIVQKYS